MDLWWSYFRVHVAKPVDTASMRLLDSHISLIQEKIPSQKMGKTSVMRYHEEV